MGLDGFEPPRPDAEERPPAMGLDGFEPPADDDAPSTAAPPESPNRPEHAVHADHVEDGRVLVHHDTENNYGGDDSEDDYAEDDFDDVFDAEDIAADEAAADEPTAEPAEPAQEADIWTAEPEVPGYADGAADEARAFLEQARARRPPRDRRRGTDPGSPPGTSGSSAPCGASSPRAAPRAASSTTSGRRSSRARTARSRDAASGADSAAT